MPKPNKPKKKNIVKKAFKAYKKKSNPYENNTPWG